MKIQYLYGLSGILIIGLFVACAIFLALNKEKISYDEQTMSSIASNPQYTNWVRFFCWTVSILVIPYILGLMRYFGVELTSPSILLGILASVGLFFTALTIDKPASHLHQIASLVFYISLFVMPLDIAIRLLGDDDKLIGYLVISLFLVSLVLLAGNFIKERGKPDGITEVILMGTNSAWVVIYSVMMLMRA